MRNQSTITAQKNARVLRREMTDAERKLWCGVRGEPLGVSSVASLPPEGEGANT